MNRFVPRVAGSWVTMLSLSSAVLARAQNLEPIPAPLEAAGSSLVTPPELLEPAAPEYPAAARAKRLEGTVLLQLTIAASGQVTGVRVLEPAGHGFDEAAQEAARHLGFAPARYRGRPVVGMVRYRFTFQAPPPPRAEELTAGPALAPAAPAAPEEPASEAVEPATGGGDTIFVVGQSLSAAQQLQQSADAVQVLETRVAKAQTADLGEVLARTQGVAVRREGGLGSTARFTLNGLTEDQVRFFLDGVPLDQAGFPFGVANVPVNLVDRVEVYRGVVPVRFGADALGGAVNLVGPEARRSHAGGSYQVGSFGTHRATLDSRYRHEPSGFVLGQTAFVDSAENDYKVEVPLPQPDGTSRLTKVRRFHDAYRAYGGTVYAGVVDRPWARRLLLTGFASTYDKQLQHDVVMVKPYGEVEYGDTLYGATARYDVALSTRVSLELTANYSRRIIDFLDDSEWQYDWLGRRMLLPPNRGDRGETSSKPSDSTLWQDATFGRALATWQLVPDEHIVRLSLAPVFTRRTGHQRLLVPNEQDPLDVERKLLTVVAGLEYETDLFEERLSNIVFVKDYVYHADGEEVPPAGGEIRRYIENKHAQGIGDALRYRFTPWLYAKASYEYATRLPRPDEVFGNGALIRANLRLKPEVSHNANIGPRVQLEGTPIGDIVVDVNAFLRMSDLLIVLLASDMTARYDNVYKARGFGVENAASWRSPGGWAILDGTLTWQDVRNVSKKGAFGADVEGDRIPNRPYLLGSWGVRLHVPNMPGQDDSIEPFYYGRYVHSFFRSWESLGNAVYSGYKGVVDSQLTHDLGISWLLSRRFASTTATLEAQNITDAKVYDNFGVQRPGRAFYFKLTGRFP